MKRQGYNDKHTGETDATDCIICLDPLTAQRELSSCGIGVRLRRVHYGSQPRNSMVPGTQKHLPITSTVKEGQEQNTKKTRHESNLTSNCSRIKSPTGKLGCGGLQVATKEHKGAWTKEHIRAERQARWRRAPRWVSTKEQNGAQNNKHVYQQGSVHATKFIKCSHSHSHVKFFTCKRGCRGPHEGPPTR
eukprot:scaffold712_cov69-Cyclotella_meneghiniana.AAC.7